MNCGPWTHILLGPSVKWEGIISETDWPVAPQNTSWQPCSLVIAHSFWLIPWDTSFSWASTFAEPSLILRGKSRKKNTCLLSLNQSCEIEMAQISCLLYIKGTLWPGTRKERLHSKHGRCDEGSGCQFPTSSRLQESFWDRAFILPLDMGLGSESSKYIAECWGTRAQPGVI